MACWTGACQHQLSTTMQPVRATILARTATRWIDAAANASGPRRASGERTLAQPTATDGRLAVVHRRFRAAGPGGEECGSEAQLGPGEIGQFFLHGCANRFPRTAHDPLIYGGERPHSCGSKLR